MFNLFLVPTGPAYWVFDGDRMIEENLPISWLGLPDGIDQLDAAFVWGKNKKTYFFRYIHHFDINETASLYLFSTGAETEKKKKKQFLFPISGRISTGATTTLKDKWIRVIRTICPDGEA